MCRSRPMCRMVQFVLGATLFGLIAASCARGTSQGLVSGQRLPTGGPMAPAEQQPRHAQFVATSARFSIGEMATFSGTDCRAPAVVEVLGGSTAYSAGTSGSVTPGSSGHWSLTIPVTDSTALGAISIRAYCILSRQTLKYWAYAPLGIRISTPRRISLSPVDSVRIGSTIEIVSRGACPLVPRQMEGVVNIGSDLGTAAPVNSSGNWSARLLIPSSTRPGIYSVTSFCNYVREIYAFYMPSRIRILPR